MFSPLFRLRSNYSAFVTKGLMSLGTLLLLANGSALAQSTGSSAPTPQPSTLPSVTSGTRFSCQTTNGQYTVMYAPESQPGKLYAWATPMALGGGWSPERRCSEISRRLEFYRPDGLLEMQTGTENGYNTVCVTTQRNAACRIVLTVPPGQDPLSVRDRVFENLTVADSGQQTSAVNTYRDGNGNLLNQIGQVLNLNLPGSEQSSSPADSIQLRPFLDQADGGTGTRLQEGATPSNRRLNPDQFR
jgi:hypothetical protein